MTGSQTECVRVLQAKLEEIDTLEKTYAPKGISFSVTGQEFHTSLSTATPLRDPIGAADSVLRILESVKALSERSDEVMAKAQVFAE